MSEKISQFEAEAIRFKIEREKAYGVSQLAAMFKAGLDITGANPQRPDKPFAQNSWVNICVNTIIQAARSIEMMISTADDRIVEGGDVWEFFFNNPEFSFTNFITETAGFLSIHKACYWIYADMDLAAPKKIIVAGPEQVRPEIRRGVLVGYKFHQPGVTPIPLFVEDVWPLLDFNPYSKFHGVGPAEAGKLAISASYQASLFNESALANGGMIGNLISYPQNIAEEEKRTLRSQFEHRHRGARNAGKVCIVSGGAKVESMATSMLDMQMLEQRQYDAKEICSLFGVPPEIVGLNSEAQYAHGPANYRFIAGTIAGLLSFIGEHVTDGIISKFKYRQANAVTLEKSQRYAGPAWPLRKRPSWRAARIKAVNSSKRLFAWFAIEDHPTMQEAIRDRTEKILKFTTAGIPLNQLIDAYDLPVAHTDWGDDWWISAGMVPARFTLEAGAEGLGGESMPEGDSGEDEDEKTVGDIVEKTQTDPAKLRLWRRWVVSWAGIEREYNAELRKLFLRQQSTLIAKLKAAMKKTKSVTKADADRIVARIVFDLKKEDGKLKVINNVFFDKASELGVRQGLTELTDLSGDELTEKVEQVKHLPRLKGKKTISTQKLSKVNRTTQKLVADQLRAGLNNGEGLDELSVRLKQTLGANRARAMRIARTQTAGAVGSGRHEGLRSAGCKLKSWITSGDDGVRDAHAAAGVQYAAGIPVEQPFVVAGETLMYPADPAGSAGNIINCRCVEIAKTAAGKTFEAAGYPGFYSYEQMNKDWSNKNVR